MAALVLGLFFVLPLLVSSGLVYFGVSRPSLWLFVPGAVLMTLVFSGWGRRPACAAGLAAWFAATGIAAFKFAGALPLSLPVFGIVTLVGPFILFIVMARLRRRAAGNDDEPMTSLVLLLSKSRYLEARVLAELASEVFEERFSFSDSESEGGGDPEDESPAFVVGASPAFLLRCRHGSFLVNNFEIPYVADPEDTAESIPDLRTRKAFTEHSAWLSVDLMTLGEGQSERAAAYPWIAKLIAELAAEDTVAIYCPESNALYTYDEEMADKLRGPDPLEGIVEVVPLPVIQVADDDPRMQSAIQEARERWPEFLDAFQTREPDDRFGIKAPITSGDHTEFIWIAVDGIAREVVFGRIDNEPVDLPGYQLGTPVEIEAGDISDWVFTRNGDMKGAFTAKVLQALHEEQAREASSG